MVDRWHGVMAAVLNDVGTVPVVRAVDDGKNKGDKKKEAGFDKLCGKWVKLTGEWFGFQDEICDHH